ncbi:MAG: AI-2E family transporter [Minisyncoccia bacterium]
MSYQKSELYFLIAILLGAGLVVFFILQPFLYPLILATIFATVFSPVHRKILSITQGNHGLSALSATLLVFVAILLPVAFLSKQIFSEATQLYTSLVNTGGAGSLSQVIEGVIRGLGIPFLPTASFELGVYLKQGLSFLIQHLDTIFSNVAKIMVDIFILSLALYYLFKDGHKLKKTVIVLSPLQDTYDESIFRKLEVAINSVVKGNLSVALIQGILTTIGLTLFGVPNPVLWGSAAFIAALVPGFGTSLVLLPAILYLFFTGATGASAGLLVWWVLAVGMIDNFLGPKLVGRGVQLHPFLILLSIFGGIGFFGPMGFLLGPLALSLLFAILEIYATVRGERTS